MTDLGLGGPDSQAFGINDSDQVVGDVTKSLAILPLTCLPLR